MTEREASGTVIRLETVDSTNTYLKKLALNGAPDGTVVTALHQTAGRGRTGNSFVSEDGGLYFSMLLRTADRELAETVSLTTKTGVAASQAVCDITGETPGIKWVNDLILHGKKIAGILVEAGKLENGRIPYAVIGIGINVNQIAFPDSIAVKASSLRMELGREFSLNALTEALIRRLDGMRDFSPERERQYLALYRERCVTLGKTVTFERNGEHPVCTATGITEDYGLTVAHPDGTTEILRSGEVHVRGLDGYI